MKTAKAILVLVVALGFLGAIFASSNDSVRAPRLYFITTTTTAVGGPLISYCTTSPCNSIAGFATIALHSLYTSITTTNTTTVKICKNLYTHVCFIDSE